MTAVAGRAVPSRPPSRERNWTLIGRRELPGTGYDSGSSDRIAHEWLGGRGATRPTAVGRGISLTCTPLILINKCVTMIIMEKQELNFERCSQ
jgi:hypothetical protein